MTPFGMPLLAVAFGVAAGPSPSGRVEGWVYGGTGALFGAMMIGASYLIESPIERLSKVWATDPGMQRMQPSVAPLVAPVQGGLTLGFVGRF